MNSKSEYKSFKLDRSRWESKKEEEELEKAEKACELEMSVFRSKIANCSTKPLNFKSVSRKKMMRPEDKAAEDITPISKKCRKSSVPNMVTVKGMRVATDSDSVLK